jgi:DNA-binding NtrC family response regulator
MMTRQNPFKIIAIDDDPDVLEAMRFALGPMMSSHHLGWAEIAHPDLADAELAKSAVAAVLLDLNFQRGSTSAQEGIAWLSRAKKRWPHVPIVVVTAHSELSIAVKVVKSGAFDFVAKPWDNLALIKTVQQAIDFGNEQANQISSQVSPTNNCSLVGSSMAMRRLREMIERVAPTMANVLILGENGTGKELVARAIHFASDRSRQPFVSVDLGAIQETLFESELFGHLRGAFTDAKDSRIGRWASADKGTLFLDEIGNLPLALQPKLLSALEQRQVIPLGSNQSIPIDCRVISATNASQEQLEDSAKFRSDLLFRLNTVVIEITPLRERKEDIPDLIAHYLTYFLAFYKRDGKVFSENAMSAMMYYDWPGNVRALKHVVERSVILSEGPIIQLQDLGLSIQNSLPKFESTFADQSEMNLDAIERKAISQALNQFGWNITLAAKALGLSRAALYRRMERHGL